MNKKQLPQPTGLHNEKTELLITPHLNDEQLPNVLREALSIVPKGEMQDMLLLSILTNCAYALPAMRMWHGQIRGVRGEGFEDTDLAALAHLECLQSATGILCKPMVRRNVNR